jgi:hypothetical protein
MTPQELKDLSQNTKLRVIRGADTIFDVGQIIYRDPAPGDCLHSSWCSESPDGRGQAEYMMHTEVELVVEEAPAVVVCGTIARPVLEERKVGKIAIELFDHGFPNAIMAVGEVMTWAAEHKGYKPHDWKNLPNAEISFDAAASRHRIKRHIQAGKGLTPEFRTDEESDLLHLAHEAFNVLAQLELTITGGIQ